MTAPHPDVDGRSARPLIVGALALAAAFVAYLAFGMPGMDHGADGTMGGASGAGAMSDMDHGEGAMALDPADFAGRLDGGEALLVNVHPGAPTIPGTDLTVAVDGLGAEVPADRSARILIYCQTGRMSAAAADDLVREGYADVSYLRGGVDAWAAAGYETS